MRETFVHPDEHGLTVRESFTSRVETRAYGFYVNPQRLHLIMTREDSGTTTDHVDIVLDVTAQEALLRILMRMHEDRIAADQNAVPL